VARRTTIATLLAVAAAGLSVPAALAAPLRQIASPVLAFSSDGVRYAAWEAREGAPVLVLDTRSGRRASFPLAAGCRILDEGEGGGFSPTSAGGRVLIDCGDERYELLDERTGASRALPSGTTWYALGTRYARGNDAGEHQVVYDLSSGSVRHVGEAEYADLDRPGAPGLRSVCPALRRVVRREALVLLEGGVAYGGGVFASPLGEHGAVQIARCRGARAVLPGQRVSGRESGDFPRDFDLRGGLLSWDTGSQTDTTDGGDEGAAGRFSARLNVVEPRSRRRRSWRLPRRAIAGSVGGPGFFGYSAHTSRAVFWVATRSVAATESGPVVASYTLYSAPL
jgi:hypothetical protein